ncbi:hypothetical protein M422DRAFT_24683 [Sphaerobolus stellatus SS14]|nr:hypothetical protein M422DRAFT_24683 [Sphaerobolus stellatus SS14]
MSYSVKVANLNPTTAKENLSDFFSFCGKITSIDHDAASKTATINFEKSSAAKTALMLNGGTLDGNHLEVTSDNVAAESAEHHEEHADGAHFDQSDKPKAGIAAEYLAKGYTLSDNILQRAIELDAQQGISARFLSYMRSIDTTLGSKVVGPEQTISGKVQQTLTDAQSKAKDVDQQKGITETAQSYYTKALQHPFGKKVFEFYTSTTKQIQDIHEEAKRIAEHQKGATGTTATPPTATATATDTKTA